MSDLNPRKLSLQEAILKVEEEWGVLLKRLEQVTAKAEQALKRQRSPS